MESNKSKNRVCYWGKLYLNQGWPITEDLDWCFLLWYFQSRCREFCNNIKILNKVSIAQQLYSKLNKGINGILYHKSGCGRYKTWNRLLSLEVDWFLKSFQH